MKILKNLVLFLLVLFIITHSDDTNTTTACVGPANPRIGGKVLYFNPRCEKPIAINFSSNHSAYPSVGNGTWMMLPGSKTFPMYPSPIPSQDVLGLGLYGFLPCLEKTFWGYKKIGPGGPPVLYIGGSPT